MDVKMEPSWKTRLAGEFEKDYFVKLTDFVRQEYRQTTVYPSGPNIFNAFAHCPFDRVKVVIIGQDPYHEPGQAHGLCFSVQDGTPFPPSLQNIFKEITDDLGRPRPTSGDLTRWADQGVLLLNASLTVERGKAGSHSRIGWQLFTNAVIEQLSRERSDLIFMLWGNFAKEKIRLIDADKHYILTSVHPSPLAGNGFIGCSHFLSANQILEARGEAPINWQI